jgi:DNA invertase Pin-like site-specific DNA recombinase
MRYGYGRVSSTTRYAGGEDGNSLEAQEKKLIEAGCTEIMLESFTGTKMERPKFTRLIEKLKAGDTLVVCKLDRFARTATDGVNLIKELLSRGVSVHVLNMGLVEDTPTGRLVLTIMMAFAEYERDMIIERLNDGKAEAKAKNPEYREGRKYIEVSDLDIFRERVAEGVMTVTEACAKLGISRSKWYKEISCELKRMKGKIK